MRLCHILTNSARRVAGAAALMLWLAGAQSVQAQLVTGGTKFVGNIAQQGGVRSDFGANWNQITAENGCKWGVVEATQGQKNFAECDEAYQYAKTNKILFKFHTLVWGSQFPKWLTNLSQAKQLEAVISWMDAVKTKYPDLAMIDVVNEAVTGHAPAPFKAALGGDGVSGHDWVIESFRMARARWPKAILILNDYNNFRWNVDDFIAIAKKVKAADPTIIDAIGCQAHDLSATTGTYTNPAMSAADLTAVLKKLHDQVGLPIYVTEMDLSYQDDAAQKEAYMSLFPVLWENDHVAGITLWGYIYGQTWDQARFSGLIKNGSDRPAFTWLKDYLLNHPTGVRSRQPRR